MASLALSVHGLGKRYRIRGAAAHDRTLRETLTDALAAPLRRAVRLVRGDGSAATDLDESFWALRQVSFEVAEGEAVGIVGRNGAGKSTLLKVLSRITDPSEGTVDLHGRVGSLLEVGTGFHPELTGAENIHLNGALLGMKRREILAKFDEIVAFAEVERFIDTPVKLYSSGMYVRLAFAVAAHLEPEILIVDEVLAVGDAQFQHKCLGRMNHVVRGGRTVLFVSHNMAAIQALTSRSLHLEAGRLVGYGPSAEVVRAYLQQGDAAVASPALDLEGWTDREGSGAARIASLEVLDAHGRPTTTVSYRQPVTFRLTCRFEEPLEGAFGILIHSDQHEPLVDLRSSNAGMVPRKLQGRVVVEATAEPLRLYPGEYLLSPWISDRMVRTDVDFVHFCTRLTVTAPTGEERLLTLDPVWGRTVVESRWSYRDVESRG